MTTVSGSPPLEAEACLFQRYASTQKGGTLIVEGVDDLSEHQRRLQSGAYRLAGCPRCKQGVHVHDRRPRLLAGHPMRSTEIVRFRCSDRQECGAVWQVVPRLLARHLWRAWQTVEAAVVEPETASAVPARTKRRWRARLASSAALVITTLSRARVLEVASSAVAKAGRLAVTRGELVAAVARKLRVSAGQRLSMLAELVHRAAPGVRLM